MAIRHKKYFVAQCDVTSPSGITWVLTTNQPTKPTKKQLATLASKVAKKHNVKQTGDFAIRSRLQFYKLPTIRV